MSHDQQLKQPAPGELNWEPNVNAAHIGVTARDGVITLTGNVETYSEKHSAEIRRLPKPPCTVSPGTVACQRMPSR